MDNNKKWTEIVDAITGYDQNAENRIKDEAKAVLNEVIAEVDEKSSEDKYQEAIALFEKNDQNLVPKALGILNELAEKGYVPAIKDVAGIAESQKDYEKAARLYKLGADDGDGECARCYADMIMAKLITVPNPGDAIKYYSQAADDGIPEAAFVCGEFLRNAGELGHALDAYGRALDLGYEPARIRMEQVRKQLGEDDNTNASSNEADVPWRNKDGKIECDESKCPSDSCIPKCPIHRNTTALQLMQKGNWDAALKIYQDIVEKDEDFVDAWCNMGACYGSTSRYEDAYRCFNKAYELEPRKTSLSGLARSAKDTGRVEEAIAYCKEYKIKYADSSLDAMCNELTAKLEAAKPAPEPKKEEAQMLFCRKCGAKLHPDSLFCHKCGTEVIR